MELADLDLNKVYTYADYYTWRFKERVELIRGKIFRMGPAPGSEHQRISMSIAGQLWSFLRGGPSSVFSAPFDVRIPKDADRSNSNIYTVVQPDICVVCDPSKIDERGCLGAPDIVIEILSPSNNKRELKYKHEIYEEAGVKEYWIVDPREQAVQVFTNVNGRLLASGLSMPKIASHPHC